MKIDELIKELERLKSEHKKYSNNTSMNAGYRVAIMDAIDLVKKMEQEIKNKIKGLEESIKELVKELSSKKTLTEKSILKTYDCIVTERKMINKYKSFLRDFF